MGPLVPSILVGPVLAWPTPAYAVSPWLGLQIIPLAISLFLVGPSAVTARPSFSAMSPDRCGPGPRSAIARRYPRTPTRVTKNFTSRFRACDDDAVQTLRTVAIRVWLLLMAATLGSTPRAFAHRDDYIDETFVYQTLGRGEREIELWGEIHAGSDRHPRQWYTGAFEYGATSHWTIDGAAQWVQDPSGLGFGRFRAETRYRFAEEGQGPLDLAASLEYELETARATEGEREQVLTPRLVVSRDLSTAFNTTLNLDLPVTVAPDPAVQFRYAIGARYPAEGFLRVGAEFKQFPAQKSATLFPQLWFAFPHEITFKLGMGIGLGSADVPLVGRVAIESEF